MALIGTGGLCPAQGQTTIDPANRYAWMANSGWMDLGVPGVDGVAVTDTFLAGYAYAANFGWIHFGSGAPANGHSYSNSSAQEFGVNLSPSGALTGYAYAANVGWINFEQSHGQPRIDLLTGRFSGHAYAANMGWLALNTSAATPATLSIRRTDTDADGIADAWEQLHFGNLTTAGATSDFDGDGASDSAEYQAGTLPRDAASVLRITAFAPTGGNTGASLTWTMVPVRRYRVEYNNPLTGTWTTALPGLFTPPPAATATTSISGLPAAPRRFFRVVSVRPL